MGMLFDQYFKNPNIYCSTIDKNRFSPICQNIQGNINIIVGHDINYWFLENFMWYYDKNIVLNMIDEYGDIYSIIDNVYHNGSKFEGVFEILLYQNFLYDNRTKYNYNVINVTDMCKKYLSPYIWKNYYFNCLRLFRGDCGLLEQTLMLVDDKNVVELAELYKRMGFNIIRCEVGSRNINSIKFVDIVQPKIFAASQNHCFGVLANKRRKFNFKIGNINKNFIARNIVKKLLRKIFLFAR